MTRLSSATLLRAAFATLALGVMVFAIVVLVAPSSQAAPAGNCTYYSNASYSKVVGQFGYDCCNNYVAWGVKSKYSRCGGCFICYPPAP